MYRQELDVWLPFMVPTVHSLATDYQQYKMAASVSILYNGRTLSIFINVNVLTEKERNTRDKLYLARS